MISADEARKLLDQALEKEHLRCQKEAESLLVIIENRIKVAIEDLKSAVTIKWTEYNKPNPSNEVRTLLIKLLKDLKYSVDCDAMSSQHTLTISWSHVIHSR